MSVHISRNAEKPGKLVHENNSLPTIGIAVIFLCELHPVADDVVRSAIMVFPAYMRSSSFRLSSLLRLYRIGSFIYSLSFISSLLSLLLLIFPLLFSTRARSSYLSNMHIHMSFTVFSIFLSSLRGRHSVAFCLYLSATGCLFVAQPLYIKRQGVCYFPPLSRVARWFRVVGQTAGIRHHMDLLPNRYYTPPFIPSCSYLLCVLYVLFSIFPFAIFIYLSLSSHPFSVLSIFITSPINVSLQVRFIFSLRVLVSPFICRRSLSSSVVT